MASADEVEDKFAAGKMVSAQDLAEGTRRQAITREPVKFP
jgi:hypothetical protein